MNEEARKYNKNSLLRITYLGTYVHNMYQVNDQLYKILILPIVLYGCRTYPLSHYGKNIV